MTRRMLAVLVTGDRNCTEKEWAPIVMEALREHWPPFSVSVQVAVLIHGDNGRTNQDGSLVGLDRIAQRVARTDATIAIIPMPFMEGVGLGGGPRRNEQMVRVLTALRTVGYETVCLAFHDTIAFSKGTKDCHNRAFTAGHPCFVVDSLGVETQSEGTV